MKRVCWISLLGVMLGAQTAPAQDGGTSLSGIVADPTSARVAGAGVYLRSDTATYEILTDSTGAFKFENLKAGEYALAFSAPGFQLRMFQLQKLAPGEHKLLPEVRLDVGRYPEQEP